MLVGETLLGAKGYSLAFDVQWGSSGVGFRGFVSFVLSTSWSGSHAIHSSSGVGELGPH